MSNRFDQLKRWLETDAGVVEFRIEPASEDASFRRYFRVFAQAGTWIVMDAPPDKEPCDSFIDVTRRLLDAGVNAPTIQRQDRRQGFYLLSDLGEHQYLQAINNDNADALYRDAITTLHLMQSNCTTQGLPEYNEALLRKEMMLFNDWLVGKHIGQDLSVQQDRDLAAIQDLLVRSALEQPQVFVHRDYHSRNLMLNSGHNPGVLDYQDAVYGPITYDIVSLLRDCYVKWPADQVQAWLSHYTAGLGDRLDGMNPERIKRWFDLMGVQRHLKASGIFSRLYHRDGKNGYLKDIPRTLSYITDLGSVYGEIEPLCELIDTIVLPRLQQVSD